MKISKAIKPFLFATAAIMSLACANAISNSIPQPTVVKAAVTEIVDKGNRITWVDAAADLPNNYANIIGFSVNVRLETDHTNYTDGYGGVTEDPDSPEYNMKFPCYMLDAFRGSIDSDVLNKSAYGCAADENYEHILNSDLAAKEICKLGVGSGYYVTGYLDKGVACKEGNKMVAGDEATLTYKGTEALFEQGNSMMTFFGYTAEFTILGIDWITGTPVIDDQEDWKVVEKTTINDIETVEKASDQNGSNYVNIIEPKEGEGPFPVVLWIHGGGWTTSSRTDIILNTTMEYFLSKGYAFVSAEYTLSDRNAELTEAEQAKVDAAATKEEKDSLTEIYKIKNPTHGKQMIYDLKLAVRFLRANASKYNLDTTFITAMGESAGAHLSLLLSTTNDSAEHEGPDGQKYGGWSTYSSAVQCAVAYSLPTDLTNDSISFLADYKDTYPLLKTSLLSDDAQAYENFLLAYCLMGYSYIEEHTISGTPGTLAAQYDNELLEAEKFMSPYWQVDSDSAPMYLVHGEADEAVLISQAYAMELAAKQFMDEADVKATYWPECTHVEKKYMDAYAQYKTSYDYVEGKRESYTPSPTPSSSSSSEGGKTSSGCGGSIIGASSALVCLGLVGAIVLVARRKQGE